MNIQLLKRLLERSKSIHDYVILKKDEKGFYIEYAFCDGAPHDNRCLDWYHSYQPEARKRNSNWDDELLANYRKCLDKKIGKIYYLTSFTCGGEENPEKQVERHRESFDYWHPEEEFIPENYVCKVGKPSKHCRASQCTHWTYEEPVKCACWHLDAIDPEDIAFHFTLSELEEFIKTAIE